MESNSVSSTSRPRGLWENGVLPSNRATTWRSGPLGPAAIMTPSRDRFGLQLALSCWVLLGTQASAVRSRASELKSTDVRGWAAEAPIEITRHLGNGEGAIDSGGA